MITIDQLQNHIICADCFDILRQLPDKCVDLVLTDPPYGIDISKTGKVGRNNLAEVKDYGKKDWDNSIPSKDVFNEIIRVSKHAIIFGGNYFVENLYNSSCWLVWNKLNTGNFVDCELAWTNFDTQVRKYDFLYNGMIKDTSERTEQRIHPTQKPVGLFMKILQDYSNENDLVLDCFSGSGTTAVACHNLHRRFICIERDKEYCEASIKRLEEAQRQQTLF